MPTENETLLNIETEVNNILNDLDLFTKLTKIEDFMKEKYNVEITNDAEVANGYVTYTANVTDADGAPAEGVLIRFLKSTGELLGKAVSDSNGDVSVSLQQDNCVFLAVANVDCTPYADMQEMYVREADNLMPLNVWSGTDVTHDKTGFVAGAGVNVSSSTMWSSIGDYSLEMIKTGRSSFTVYANSTQFMGFEALTCKLDVLTNAGSMVVRLGTPNYPNIASTTVPASEEPQTIMLSATLPPGEEYGRISFLPQTDDVAMYVDNIYLTGTGENHFLFYDPGLTGTRADWRNWNNNGTRTPTSTGTVLACTETVSYMVFANAYGTTANVYDYNAPYTVEFDLVSQTESPYFQIYSADTGVDESKALSVAGHYKFTYDGETMQWWIGETEQEPDTVNLTNARIGFRVAPGKSLKFKEFKIYKEDEE